MFSGGRRTRGRLTGNVGFCTGGGRRFLGRPSISALPPARRRTRGRLTGNVRFGAGGGRRFLGRFSLSTFSCTRLIRSARLFHRAGLLRGRRFRARQVRASRFWRFWFGRLRFFRGRLLFLW